MNATIIYVLSFPRAKIYTCTHTHRGKDNECIEKPKLTSDFWAQAVYRSPGTTSFQPAE